MNTVESIPPEAMPAAQDGPGATTAPEAPNQPTEAPKPVLGQPGEPVAAPDGRPLAEGFDMVVQLHKGVRKRLDALRPDLLRSLFEAIQGGWRPPSPEQAATGEYPKPVKDFQGIPVLVENPAGTLRAGTDRDGTAWASWMLCDYGYIPRSEGADGEGIDCFVGPDVQTSEAYIVRQLDPRTGDPDEDKIMLGFASKTRAMLGYLVHYDRPEYLGDIQAMPVDDFKRAVTENRLRWSMKKKYRQPTADPTPAAMAAEEPAAPARPKRKRAAR